MKRKVVQQGPSTLMVSLPSKWVKENGVKKGDELDVEGKGQEINISTAKNHNNDKKEIEILIDNMTYVELAKYFSNIYRSNCSKLTLNYSKNEILDNRKNKTVPLKKIIKKLVNRHIGAEIMSQSQSRTIIEILTNNSERNLKAVEQRILFLIKETVNELLLATKENYTTFHETIYDHHDNIAKFINYYLREVNLLDIDPEIKTYSYVLYLTIDKLVDKLRHLSEKINEFGVTKKVQEYIEETFELFYDMFNLVENPNDTDKVIKKRYNLIRRKNEDKFTPKEYQVISELDLFHNCISNFLELGFAQKQNAN